MAILESLAARSLRGTGVSIRHAGTAIPREPCDIVVHSPRIFSEYLFRGSLGLGESYVRRDWDCDKLDDFFCRVVQMGHDRGSGGIARLVSDLHRAITNAQSRARAGQVIGHYDIGNDLYTRMLGPSMVYTCGYRGRGAKTLEDMQRDKLQLICDKLQLKPGDRVLDIGCGFGSFANHAAGRGAEVVGITPSQQQRMYALEHAMRGVSIENLEYRDLDVTFGKDAFDHVVSIGMFEAVGRKNFDIYMSIAHHVLKPGGAFLLHTITMENGGHDPWLNKYIFPNGELPSEGQVLHAAEMAGFQCLDIHEFGSDYDPTLMAWYQNLEDAWPDLLATGTYDERFRRMFRYYLLQCAGLFRARQTNLHQFLLYKDREENLWPPYRQVR